MPANKTKARKQAATTATPRKPKTAKKGKPSKPPQPETGLSPRPSVLRALYEELQSYPNVAGVFLGKKRMNGRLTNELSVVVCVTNKLPHRALSKADRVPRSTQWGSGSAARVIATDVQVLGGGELQAAVLGPGDGIVGVLSESEQLEARSGTIGIAMRHPTYGPVVTTAAHVFGMNAYGTVTYQSGFEPRVALANAGSAEWRAGIVHKMVITPASDYAIIGAPAGTDVENLFGDRFPLGHPYAPDLADIGRRAYVLTNRGIRQTTIRGIHAAISVGPLGLQDLILTDDCTLGGDSGACLVDSTSRAMGLLEGITQVNGNLCSVFSSVAWPFVNERGHFF